ncbi:MAG: DapH/DapD/GlmU-related protein [Desulfosarcinaceae bacterium]|nr:DapH/DapD/GlmU-related protein [Desulfosarcinaceae bacterium]
MRKKKLGPLPTIAPSARVKESHLGDWTEVGANTTIIESRMEDYSYAVNDCHIVYAAIGRFCSIAAHVRLNPGNHPLERAALHHFTYRSDQFDMGPDDAHFFDWRRSFPVVLGHDVWVGHGATVLPGVRIGSGAAIGAGSVVTKDVADFTVVAGVPAKPLRQRFAPAIQAALLEIAWWDWPHARLKERLPDLRQLSIEAFVEKYAAVSD